MRSIRSGLCWAAAILLLALAKRLGWIADQDATMMFAILPALWVASGGLVRSCRPEVAA